MQLQDSLLALSPESRKAMITQLFILNEEHALGKFRGDCNAATKQLIDALEDDAERTISDEESISQLAFDQISGKASALVVGQPASWDSKQFGRSRGKLTLALFDPDVQRPDREDILRNIVRRLNAQMLAARVSLRDINTVQALEDMGAVLTDVLLTFRFDLLRMELPQPSSSSDIGFAKASDELDLRRLGRTVFSIDRFHGDPGLPKSKSDLAYEEWVANSLHGFADAVIVARRQSRVVGFITCKIDRVGDVLEFGVIDLVGVDFPIANNGVGRQLVASALQWFKPKVRSVYVGTQASNTRAVRLYEKSGFLHVNSEATLHLWRNSFNERVIR